MKKEQKRKKRRSYDASFKQSALDLLDQGRSVPSVAEGLGISESMLYKWRNQARKREKASPISKNEVEIKSLQRRIKELEQERDILKKALGILSRPT